MSNVTLRIGGRDYTVACAEGEERHIAMLGQSIDDKLQAMGAAAGQSEVRQLLFAALVLADEAHELRSAARKLDPARLEAIAARLENCASALEG